MKVACPHCSASYNVDDRRVPASGLNVRCPKCRDSFPVRPEPAPEAASAADAPVPLPAPVGAPASPGRVPPSHGGSIPLPPPFPARAAPAATAPAPAGAPASAPAIPLPAPGPRSPAGAAPIAPPTPFEVFAAPPPALTPAGIPLPPPGAPPVPDPFAAGPEPADPEPFDPPTEKFGDLDPLPVPVPEPVPSQDPFAAAPAAEAPFDAEPFPTERAEPATTAPIPELGFGEVDLAPAAPAPPRPPPAGPFPAPSAPAAFPTPGEELEMLFGEGAAPKPAAGFKVRRRSGKIFGPFEEAQIVDMLANGELMGNEDVAQDGGAWTPIGAVPAFGDALRKLSAEPAGVPSAAELAREPQRLVPFGDRMAPARLSEDGSPARGRRRLAIAGVAALVVAAAAAAGVLRFGPSIAVLLRRGDPARAGALATQARALATKDDYAAERGALDLAAQAVAADPRSADTAGLHAAIVAALERRHGAPPEALAQARTAAERLAQSDKGEIGTLAAQLAVALAAAPGPATQPDESALEQAAQKRAPDAELLALLARAALGRGDGARADALFARLAALEPGVRALHGAGLAALARRDPAAARASFAKALDSSPVHLPTRLELAALSEADGDVAGAEAQLGELLAPGAETRLGPLERARALMLRGRILARSGSSAAEAEAAFAGAVEADPRLFEARIALARHRLRRGDPAGAVSATDPVAAQAARAPALGAVRIRALALAGRALDASSLAATALQASPGDLGLLLARGTALEASAKPDEAAAVYRDAAGRDPSAFEPRLALGRIALSRHDLAQAATELAAAVEKGPREPAAQAALGELRAAQGDAAAAEAAYRAALALDPEHANAEIGLAKLAVARGDAAGARARLERALAEDPRNVDGHVAYGTLLWRSADLPAAERALQAAVELAPRHALALSRLGAVKLERGDAAGAVKALNTASNEDERLAEARLWLGRALLAKGETPAAIAQLKKAVELEPAAAEHHLRLGEALERAAAPQEAIDAYRAAAVAAPRSPDPHERVAAVYVANARCDEAVPELEKAIAIAPKVPRVRVALGDCKAKLGKHEEAARIFRELLKADPREVQVVYRLARAVHESESARAALPLYERAAREDGQNPMPHYYLGYLYKEKSQRARAVQEFKRYLSLKPDADEKKDILAEIEDLEPR